MKKMILILSAAIVVVISAITFLKLGWFGNFGTNNSTDSNVVVDSNIHYYNLEEGLENIFNFGPASTATTEKEAIVELEERCSKDPVLLSALVIMTDNLYGTNFGSRADAESYMTCANRIANEFAQDSKAFRDTRERLLSFLRANSEIELRQVLVLYDQMYMNPFVLNASGGPELVIFETEQTTSTVLTFWVDIKGNKIPLNLRLACGFQPTDVAETLGEKPQSVPTTSEPISSSGETGSTVGKSGGSASNQSSKSGGSVSSSNQSGKSGGSVKSDQSGRQGGQIPVATPTPTPSHKWGSGGGKSGGTVGDCKESDSSLNTGNVSSDHSGKIDGEEAKKNDKLQPTPPPRSTSTHGAVDTSNGDSGGATTSSGGGSVSNEKITTDDNHSTTSAKSDSIVVKSGVSVTDNSSGKASTTTSEKTNSGTISAPD